MRCDGKNPNCDRRRELLSQLKCLVSSMEKKKPCEWDEPLCPPSICCYNSCSMDEPPCSIPVKRCKSFNFRASIMYRCECIKRNGLQDRCMMWDCMGRPECMSRLYPVCGPGHATLLKLTDLGDPEVALKKFYCADQARESALAAYCRLVCENTAQDRCTEDKNTRSLCHIASNGNSIEKCNKTNNYIACSPCGYCSPPSTASFAVKFKSSPKSCSELDPCTLLSQCMPSTSLPCPLPCLRFYIPSCVPPSSAPCPTPCLLPYTQPCLPPCPLPC